MSLLNKLLRNRSLFRQSLNLQTGRFYSGYLREAYHCNEAWAKRLESPLLQKVNLDDFFFEMDKKYQTDNVLSAIDVDIFINKVSDAETLDEIEELTHRLRKSPATCDSLPSTSHAVIRAFLNGGRTEDLMRILNDRMNYGVFIDFHVANILMDEFIKQGNHRDAAKVAGLLMLEEDFGPPTTKFMSLVSCLKYLQEPTPEPWDPTAAPEESKEEVKVRVKYLRNPYYDAHFDLSEPNQIVGKSLALLGKEIKEDKTLSRSVELIGWAVFGLWEKVDSLLKDCISSKVAVAEESFIKVSQLLETALNTLESSPTKSLPLPKLPKVPGVISLNEKEMQEFWTKKIKIPDYSKILPGLKITLSSGKVPVTKNFNLLSTSEKLLSSALSEREDLEIQEQVKTYEMWDKLRLEELQNQIRRFKTNQIIEDIEKKKKDLCEKEEVIFFFDHEEDWMMRLPPDEQKGYKLDTNYIPTNQTKFVKTIPIKKIKKKKTKV